jgi:hypothetical protein
MRVQDGTVPAITEPVIELPSHAAQEELGHGSVKPRGL